MSSVLKKTATDARAERTLRTELFERYGCGPVQFSGNPNASYERHLVLDHVVKPGNASAREVFEALARSLRDLIAQRWLKTGETCDRENPKQVYYLSMEFLIGRSTSNNLLNLLVEPFVREEMARRGVDLDRLDDEEPDAGLGNGGLGRLAACFIDSMATLAIPAIGYGLRYEYGIFRQEIQGGRQVERPDNWLRRPDPWEVDRPAEAVDVRLQCAVQSRRGTPVLVADRPTLLRGVPYDRPVVGHGGRTVNTLRLWGAAATDAFDFAEFSAGDFFGAVHEKVVAENLTRVLYPDDSTTAGRGLRFAQEYFLVCCSLADIVRRFRARGNDWGALPDKVAVQLNDTHPALAVAELMRILLDGAGLGWDESWDLTVRTLAYTNHTLLPEALETWPVRRFELVAPRLLEIVYEINRRFLDEVRAKSPGDDGLAARVSLIEEGPEKKVRMAHLAVVGSYSTNGVAALHSRLLRETVLKDLAGLFPGRFNNKTNGVTPRRWLLLANPGLAALLTKAVGDGWVTELERLGAIAPLADDPAFRERFRAAKRAAKVRFADWLRSATGEVVEPASLFDVQIKRIHEYKRQLLNVLHVLVLYNRLRENPALDAPPRTVFFAGKAAPACHLAKVIIHLVNNVAAVIDADPAARGRLKVLFLPEYNVTLAQRLIPAADLSEQISTAGYEASGTSNMKFMMNGALTVGTRDGATIEMAEASGEQNFFLFGLTAEQVANSRGWYSPFWHVEHDPETRLALDLIRSGTFDLGEPGVFAPVLDALLAQGDRYMHLADLTSYVNAQEQVVALYGQPDAWARKAILNVAHSGRFSSDRTIAEYAADVCGAGPCPVD
ncbi:glycogen/starch/alpha-glucan phosphorylase [Paludisphaera mucosa]|uniref:Alpha-1,4 glucan phosphorylase n=1 Tax=Paludisphaera mucosa TaxID=3030827 RepID=A0ABT6FEA6_9BACT|nr:glycogen/starch/alpha-glucan phosphorylase [Paludisphaera mucosa]MDG3005913.1 glycogen/starch/alpha-glucan phosphorylase [Paludisphaera mucosa]